MLPVAAQDTELIFCASDWETLPSIETGCDLLMFMMLITISYFYLQ